MDFPQYRKLPNGLAFYKIINDEQFEELQIVGSKVIMHTILAEKYPELLKIKDLLLDNASFEMSNQEEYESVKMK